MRKKLSLHKVNLKYLIFFFELTFSLILIPVEAVFVHTMNPRIFSDSDLSSFHHSY